MKLDELYAEMEAEYMDLREIYLKCADENSKYKLRDAYFNRVKHVLNGIKVDIDNLIKAIDDCEVTEND